METQHKILKTVWDHPISYKAGGIIAMVMGFKENDYAAIALGITAYVVGEHVHSAKQSLLEEKLSELEKKMPKE